MFVFITKCLTLHRETIKNVKTTTYDGRNKIHKDAWNKQRLHIY